MPENNAAAKPRLGHWPTFLTNSTDSSTSVERYSTDGGKLSFHGYSYQLKLLMLFLLRGLNNNFQFRLATEMKDAEKFDDAVFEQRLDGPDGVRGKSFRFLQAKHNAGETRGMISVHNLLREFKGDFNLQKYFESYLKIRKNPKFNGDGDEIKDLILYTNKCFKFGDRLGSFVLSEDIFDRDKTEEGEEKLDVILGTGLLRFKNNFSGKEFIASHLKNAFTKLPGEFAEKIIADKEFRLGDYGGCKVKQSYRKALMNEVISIDREAFRASFLENTDLSPEVTHFRDALKSEFFSKHHGKEKDFENEMRKKKLRISECAEDSRMKIASPGNLAEKLAGAIRKNFETKVIKFMDSKSLVVKNLDALSGNLFVKVGDTIKINPYFVSGRDFPGDIQDFRQQFERELNKREIVMDSLLHFDFEILNFPDSNTIETEEEEHIRDAVDTFFKKLRFAVEQPGEDELDEIIKSELQREFKQRETENVYGRFLVKTFNWMKDKGGKYFSHEEGRIFFEQIKKEVLSSIWFEVKNPTFNFTGREKELIALGEAMFGAEDDQSAAVITQSVSISGLGGVGKTELAKQFVCLHSREYENIIWINAESNATMANSFRRLAFDKLGIREESSNGTMKSLESIVDEVYDFLRGKKSLFIFDNAEKMRAETEGDSGIQNFLPKFPTKSKHYTLITSRNTQWGDLKKIKLETFTEEEAVEMIGKSIDLSKHSQIIQAKQLAMALHCYPLALKQAVAYIKASDEERLILGQRYTISNYLEVFEKESTELLDFPFQSDSNDSYTKGTYTTWKITLDEIEQKENGKMAVDLLNLISYFAPDDISIENILSVLGIRDNRQLLSSLRFLKQYSMITVENGKANVHRLVQLVTRLRLKEDGREEETLRRVLNAGRSLDAEHAMSVWKFSGNYNNLLEEFSDLPLHITQTLHKNFKLKEACSFAKESIVTLERLLGGDHPSVLRVKQSLAKVLDSLGKYNEALKEFEDLFEKSKTTSGEDDPKTLKFKHYVANMIYNLGRNYEALEYYKDIHSKISSIYGENDPDALNLKHNIANVLCNLGKHKEALETYKDVHEKLRHSLGENDSSTLNAKQNIANVLERLGDKNQALICYQEVYEQSKSNLNEDHPITLTTKHNLASVLDKLGRHEEALVSYKEVYEKFSSMYGEQHPDCINTMFNISNVLFELKRYDEALNSYKSVHDKLRVSYGQSHEKTIHAEICIAQVYYKSRKNNEALEYYKLVYDKLRIGLGASHPKVLRVKQSIANTLYNLGNYDETLTVLEEIKIDLGEEHPHTMAIKQFIADVLYRLGKYDEAFNTYKEVNLKMKMIYGELDEKTLTSQQNMGTVLLKLEKFYESLNCYEDLYEKQKTVLGENHPSTCLTKEYIYTVWHKMKKKNQIENSESDTTLKNGTLVRERFEISMEEGDNNDENVSPASVATTKMSSEYSSADQTAPVLIVNSANQQYSEICHRCLCLKRVCNIQ